MPSTSLEGAQSASAALSERGWSLPLLLSGEVGLFCPLLGILGTAPPGREDLAKGTACTWSPSSMLSMHERPCALKASWWHQGALSQGEAVSTQPRRC